MSRMPRPQRCRDRARWATRLRCEMPATIPEIAEQEIVAPVFITGLLPGTRPCQPDGAPWVSAVRCSGAEFPTGVAASRETRIPATSH